MHVTRNTPYAKDVKRETCYVLQKMKARLEIMSRKPKFKPRITRVKLNPEQAVLSCDCYTGHKWVPTTKNGTWIPDGRTSGTACNGRETATRDTSFEKYSGGTTVVDLYFSSGASS